MTKRVKIPGRLESAETGNIVTGADAVMDDAKGKTQVVINSEVDAAIISLAQGKQDALTFDSAPTEGSPNPVTSAGVYTADKVLSDAIEAILLLIPSAASALNKLVDMQTMNSSIATATASFKGTYNLVSDLHLGVDATHEQIGAALDVLSLGADNNDYAFVQVPNSATAPTEIRVTERYKFNGTNWLFEYDLNNSGFTQGQWNAINSGVTSLLVGKLSDLPTNAELTNLLAGKQDNLTFDNVPTAGSPNPVKSGGVYARNNEIVALINALDAAKQDVLTFDNAPVEGSPNPVKSGGVYTAISAVQAAIVALDAAKQNVLTFDNTPTLGSPNPVTSSGIKTELNRIDGNVTTLNDLYEALTQSALVVVQPSDTWPVASPATKTIYRVVDRTNTPPQYYSDYMWNGTAMVMMAQYDNAIDDVPTVGSNNLVKSGGVFNKTSALRQNVLSKGSFSDDYKPGLISASTHLPVYTSEPRNKHSAFIPVKRGDRIYANIYASAGFMAIALYEKESYDSYIGGTEGNHDNCEKYYYEAVTDGFVVISHYKSPLEVTGQGVFVIDKKEDYQTDQVIGNSIHINETFGGTRYFIFNSYPGKLRINVPTFAGETYWMNFFSEDFTLYNYLEINSAGEYTFQANGNVAVISIGTSGNTTLFDLVITSPKKERNRPFYPVKEEGFTPVDGFSKVKDYIISGNLPASDYRSVYAGLGYDVAWDEDNNRYVLLTSGYNGIITQVGLAYSTDLVNWTDYGVVLSPTGVDGDPDSGGITFPQILKYKDEWIVYYVAFDQEGFEQGHHTICYATTKDFITYQRHGVILSVQSFIDDGIWSESKLNTGVIYRPKVINVYGKYFMFINGGPDGDALPGGPYENIYVAVSDDPTKDWHVLDKVLDSQEIGNYVCSDPDIMYDGRDFYMVFWGAGGIFAATSDADKFPLNWKYQGKILNGMRPLLMPTKDCLYMIANSDGALQTSIYKAEWL